MGSERGKLLQHDVVDRAAKMTIARVEAIEFELRAAQPVADVVEGFGLIREVIYACGVIEVRRQERTCATCIAADDEFQPDTVAGRGGRGLGTIAIAGGSEVEGDGVVDAQRICPGDCQRGGKGRRVSAVPS